MEARVGVIVPVYNTEKHVAKCIDSILAQTYTNFHLLVIDDGSPDDAGKICDEYARKDARITVIHQSNQGVNRARANGVSQAVGCDYITFVDSDDTIAPDALEKLVLSITADSDIVISYRVANVPDYPPIEEHQLTIEGYRQKLLFLKLSCAPWGKLFRKSLFDDSVFNIPREIVVGEDLLMNIRLTCNTDRSVNVLHDDIYNYNIYDENTTKRFIPTPEFESLWHRLIVASILDENERSEFIRFSIPHRIHKYTNFGGMAPNNKALLETDFYKDLKKDIIEYKYPIKSFSKRFLLYSTNTLLRTIIIYNKEIKTKISQIIRHPDYPIWRTVIKEMKGYRISPQRIKEGYFSSPPTRRNKRKRVVCIYDTQAKNGGLADRLRGILSVYHVCRKRGLEFRILFDHPFVLERYLIPNKVQWQITRNELDYNLESTDLCFISTRTGREYEMRKQHRWFRKEFKKRFNEFHVRTNAAFSYRYDYSRLFHELFLPSPLLESLIAEQKQILGESYISISFRFLDLLDDFNETFGRGTLKSKEKRQELITKCIKQIELLHEKHPGCKILINSDSTTFLQEADTSLEYTYVIPGKISHVDSPDRVEDHVHDKTFTDFFMIANAQDIYLVIADQMYDSGFPYAASRLYNHPFYKIFC